MTRTTIWITAPLLALAACGGPSDPPTTPHRDTAGASPATPRTAAPQSSPIPSSTPSASSSSSAPARTASGSRSCLAEIGAAAAAKRVEICRNVSPATHPPCNAANSCALIDDEIARSCALFDGKGAPIAGCGPAPTGMAAAAAVVKRYYAAIDARDYATAWTQWGDDGRPGQTLAAFAAGFAHTRSTTVTIGRLEPGDAGAGSIYQPVPVTVDAVLDDGTRQRFRGSYVIRRVNGVDGATASQLRWHIDSARLTPIAAN